MSVFPSENDKLIATVIMAFCFGLGVGLAVEVKADLLVGGVVTLMAAFFGAYYAFKLNDMREIKRERQAQLAALNKALFVLIRAYNFVAGYNRQFVMSVPDNPAKYIVMRPSLGIPSPSVFQLDYDSISFLVHKDKTEILGRLSEFDGLLLILIDVIKKRNYLHDIEAQPKLEAAGLCGGVEMSIQELDGILGDRLSTSLKEMTDELVKLVVKSEEVVEDLIDDLSQLTKSLFPEENVIGMRKV